MAQTADVGAWSCPGQNGCGCHGDHGRRFKKSLNVNDTDQRGNGRVSGRSRGSPPHGRLVASDVRAIASPRTAHS
ncbi:hypothetical protein AAFF_G00212720 [Aldrovandia affinis]|uniref:Uncharacterized protein n=1 Tax=Aldrovandia affinis TaxID=143900 RepID=A0AAD7W5C1_9TELE|nr:hypothetical protein AAFF_G00212720 [Aldrovandia affinis]